MRAVAGKQWLSWFFLTSQIPTMAVNMNPGDIISLHFSAGFENVCILDPPKLPPPL